MSAALSKTLKKESEMDKIFAEVPCTEDLGLTQPGQLRLFHLLVRDDSFYHADLERWLYRNLSRYVFSRARLEQFRQDDDLDAAIERAIHAMQDKRKQEKDLCASDTELGEMLIYAFLEGKLSAPKLMSRVELSTDLSKYRSLCESIHLFSGTDEHSVPFNQLVFGASNIVGNIESAVNNAFDAIMRIKENATHEIQMVEKTAFDLVCNDQESDFLQSVIVPAPNAKSQYETAYGIFLGYSIGVSAKNHPGIEFCDLVNQKMSADIKAHAALIANKIHECGLEKRSFYIYLLPFMNADSDKTEIIENVLKGDVLL